MSSRALLQKIVNVAIAAVMLVSLTMTASAAGTSPLFAGGMVQNQVDDGGPLGPQIPNAGDKDFSQKPEILKSSDPETMALMALGDTLVPVSIQLDKASLAKAGKNMTGEQRQAYAAEVEAYQNEMAAAVEAAGGKVIYRFRTLSTGFIAEMPGTAAGKVVDIPGVERVSRIYNYEKDLSETVAFLGGDALKSMGYTGLGVTVAVLDSGIDYTHPAFGGTGTVDAWEDAYWGDGPDCVSTLGRIAGCANSLAPLPGSNYGPFSPKVKGGYDWVGPIWPNGPLAPDANPIANRQNAATFDDGTHGSHVADIIAGYGFSDGSKWIGEGMAPGADLYAFTVCSQIATSCSGVAILQGLDSSADLDNNPFTYDPADVVNLSLGSIYGQPEDDGVYFVNELVAYGSIVAISAGNSANKPFIVGSPSAASGAISVAQTTVPSAAQFALKIHTDPVTLAYKPVFQPWSVLMVSPVSGEVAYDTTSTATRIGCTNAAGGNPWANPTLFTNKVLLVDRGTCAISMKAANGFAAGAKMVLIALVTADDPPAFSDGGGLVTGPAFAISQADGNLIKANLVNNITVSVDPEELTSLANNIVSSSSRGPRNHDNKIKPDIGAPGASVSAVAGSGNQASVFGGTSGAAPMVAGAAALLKQVYGDQLIPQQYKALLMNSANNQIFDITPTDPNGALLPVTRIGAGQVDLEEAINTRLLAWDVTDEDPLTWTGSLSFQYQPVSELTSITRTLRIMNMYYNTRTVYFDNIFRYSDDLDKGVTVETSAPSVTIPAGETVDVDVIITLDPAALRAWFDNTAWLFNIDRGYFGADGHTLTAFEVDGYLDISACTGGACVSSISVPWHVLPKPVGDTTVQASIGLKSLTFTNASSAADNNLDLFALVDQSANDYESVIGDCGSLGLDPGCNVVLPDIKEVGVRTDANMVEFAVSLWNEPFFAGAYPVGFDIYVDSNRDGVDDYVVYNGDSAGSNLVIIYRLATGTSSAYTYLDSTFDSNNYILPVPLFALGLVDGQSFDFQVLSYDSYFTGNYTDCAPYSGGCGYATYTVGSPRYAPDTWTATVDANTESQVSYTLDPAPLSTQTGLLVLFREAAVGMESYASVLGNNAPTQINPLEDQIAFSQNEFRFTIPGDTFSDADADDILTYSAAQDDDSVLPAWLSFDPATRTFSGTPGNQDVGQFTVKVTAADLSNSTASLTFVVNVNARLFLPILVNMP